MKAAFAQSVEQAAMFEGTLWIGAIVLAVLVAVVLLFRFRRKVGSSDHRGRPDFTLEELRALRDRGNLTAAEYDAVKERVLDRSGRFPG